MPNCPNCGQTTERTGDWACPWCGYPLLAKSYKRIPKTYRQLREERPESRRPQVHGEVNEVLPEDEVTAVTPEPEAEPVVEPEVEFSPEPGPEAAGEPEEVAGAEVVTSEAEPVAGTVLEPASEPEAAVEPEVEPDIEPEPVAEAGPAVTAMDITVEELVSAYETEGTAADARFAGKVLNITGVVDRVEVKSAIDVYYINLGSAERDLGQGVRCVFSGQNGIALAKLDIGQKVTVQGRYDGSIMDIALRNCILLRQ
ncbi:MAG: hypothetical protein Q8Q07_07675 [Dehalococcoidales bacterium]|nr:hypothetical protein [Dehalococcoidales bacterium]